ncbi:MAG: acylphosphatase [Vicingaceae bacterium]
MPKIDNEIKHLIIRVFGKVQGVYFRKSTMERAIELKVNGLVMNEMDGSVTIVAEGTKEQLNYLLLFCKEGPMGAKVTNIYLEEGLVTGFTDFKILPS